MSVSVCVLQARSSKYDAWTFDGASGDTEHTNDMHYIQTIRTITIYYRAHKRYALETQTEDRTTCTRDGERRWNAQI